MRSVAILVLLAAGIAPGAVADILVFRDGRTLKVRSYTFAGDSTSVELEGGGSMRFGSEMVKYVAPDEDIEAAPPLPDNEGPVGDWRAFAAPALVEPITRIAARHSLDPALVAAVIKVESDFRPHAVSPKGAKGLMQLMPLTAREHGLTDPFDAEANIDAGSAHLRELLGRYAGDVKLALAAYNAGQTAVDRARGIPRYPETQAYVARVLEAAGVVTR